MASLDGAMSVVTTAAGGERAGCLVGFQCQCGIEPPRYAVWLSKANRTYRVGLLATHLAVHLLTEDDGDLAEHFGVETGDEVDKFAGVRWTAGPGDVPLLERLPNRLVGRRVTLLDDGGDHVCVVLEPEAADSTGGFRPLRLADVAHLDAGHAATERQP